MEDDDFSLEDLVNMNLDRSLDKPDPYLASGVEKRKKGVRRPKKVVIEDSSSDSEAEKAPRSKQGTCMISSKLREIIIIYILFIVFSSRFAAGQADKLMRIQSVDYSIYDLMVRGIAMVLLFFIFCRLFQ